jgi:hypothetical protein
MERERGGEGGGGNREGERERERDVKHWVRRRRDRLSLSQKDASIWSTSRPTLRRGTSAAKLLHALFCLLLCRASCSARRGVRSSTSTKRKILTTRRPPSGACRCLSPIHAPYASASASASTSGSPSHNLTISRASPHHVSRAFHHIKSREHHHIQHIKSREYHHMHAPLARRTRPQDADTLSHIRHSPSYLLGKLLRH